MLQVFAATSIQKGKLSPLHEPGLRNAIEGAFWDFSGRVINKPQLPRGLLEHALGPLSSR